MIDVMGRDLRVGDVIKVWWSPGHDKIVSLEPYRGPLTCFKDGAAIARFALQDALVVHRIGRMAPGEAVVFVAAAAAHRRAAFEACDQIMDYLKSRAPFWKKQHGPDGPRWIDPTPADLADAARWDKA